MSVPQENRSPDEGETLYQDSFHTGTNMDYWYNALWVNKKVQKDDKSKPLFLIQKKSPIHICCSFWVSNVTYFPQKKIGWLQCRKFDQNYSKCKKRLKKASFSNTILSFFLGMVYNFTLQKIVAQRGRIHPFLTFIVIFVKFSALKSSNFFLKSWDIRNSKRAANINWWIFLDEKRRFIFAIFAPFYSRAALNT